MADNTQLQPQQGTTAVARTPRRQLADMVQSELFKKQVAAALPKHLTADRFCRVVVNATMRQPELLECSQESFFRACLDLSALGIEPDGRRAHLIPFWNGKMCQCGHPKDKHRGQNCTLCNCASVASRREIQLIIDYKGIAELVRRSGDVSYIHADVVRDVDEFSFSYGTDAHLKHIPLLEGGGKIIGFYSYVKLKDGSEDFIVMGKQQVDAVRKRSKSADSGPWVTDYEEMGKKTVFRRHSKWLPLSPEVRDVVEKDDDFSGGEFTEAMGAAAATLSLDNFRPSEDDHRGHDDSMTAAEAPQPEAADTNKQPESPKQQEAPRAQSTHRGPIKAVEELSDAMDFRLGYECYQGGRHYRVAEDGDLQKWVDIGAAPEVAAQEPVEAGDSQEPKLAAAPRGRGGRGNKPADAFDFNR